MVFQIGKYYQHTTGLKMHIISAGLTTLRGWTLIAETDDIPRYELTTVGSDESSAVNFKEITEDVWMESFSK